MEPVTKNLPVIAMRGLTVFPRMNTSFDIERAISVRALERAMENGEEIFLVTQRELTVELPEVWRGAWAAALSPTFRGQEGSWPVLVRASDETGEVRESTLTLRSHDGGETWGWQD